MTKIRFTPLLDDLPATVPFVGPETQERQRGAEFAARLGANENIFGPSPKAIRAMQEATSEIWQIILALLRKILWWAKGSTGSLDIWHA
jgi:histidinol-phosphate aminotransferase